MYSLTRIFGNLKVRPKLMVLHNLFFLVLTCAAYFSLIPLFERQLAEARLRESAILERRAGTNAGTSVGTTTELPTSPAAKSPAGGSPAEPAAGPTDPVLSLANDPAFQSSIATARLTLFLVLGSIYAAAVILLESAIMPLYVYRPLRRMLDADEATRSGDRERELIPDTEILGDEIGQIMRSRNDTVAQLRHNEDELASALRRIEAQDRLVSLGLLSTSVAHELNTPLAVLRGSVEQLIETATHNQGSSTQLLDRLNRIQRVTKRLQTISESLVDFSKVRKLAPEPVPVHSLIDEAWALVAIDERAARVQFSNQTSPDHVVVGNPDRLGQVFVNLLRNSLNAIDSKSPDTSAESKATEPWKIDVRSRPLRRSGQPGIAIAVEDNGPGIPAAVLPEIFDAFVTTRLDAHGTGLGLTVAQGIATQHGGSISASNRTEGGACLEVWLPAAPSV